MENKRKILIVTTCTEDWGGSEELWARTVPFLQQSSYEVSVCKEKINLEHPEFLQLRKLGVRLHQLNPLGIEPTGKIAQSELSVLLNRHQYSLVVVSQGINFDGLGMGYACLLEKIPYVLIAQKAVDVLWPYHIDRAGMRNVYSHAEKAFFVSQHNLNLTEEQFGVRFTNAEVISNPVKVNRRPIEYPSTEQGYRLACIGRFFLIDKGQDMLIRILAQEKWKKRPIHVTFIGSGIDKEGLTDLARLLDVSNITFMAGQNDIETLWLNYHVLILPSRYEGTPLVLLEAMALGRTAIVSTAGGNAELITDGETGFVGLPNTSDFELAMERAWLARDAWRDMGIAAYEKVKETVPEQPERLLAESINQLIYQNTQLVSVIIPTYNRAHIVENAIKSVLAQTHQYIELIVADDGSIDGTEQILARYPQVTYLKLTHGGQAHARNEGVLRARGHFIATLDSDDTWEPVFVATCISMINEHQLDFAFANWMQDLGDGKLIDYFTMCKILEETLQQHPGDTVILDNETLRKLYLIGCPSPSSALVFRKSSLKTRWTSELKIADDWCLLMDVVFKEDSKAALTRNVLWHKKRDGRNIYDGRDSIANLRDLWIHDQKYLYLRFSGYFTKAEKDRFTRSLANYYIQYSSYRPGGRKDYWHSIKFSTLAMLTHSGSAFNVYLRANRKMKRILKRLMQYVS